MDGRPTIYGKTGGKLNVQVFYGNECNDFNIRILILSYFLLRFYFIFRGNYAWDIAALNDNFMTYTEKGETNEKYAVWNRAVILPIAGKIVTRIEHAKDNSPNLIAAIDLDDHSDGKDVILEEKPQNLIEVKPIDGQNSPFLLRMIHLRQDFIPASIEVNFTNLKLRIWDFPSITLF